ncbi:unnamed protein product [Boreogadus saida]
MQPIGHTVQPRVQIIVLIQRDKPKESVHHRATAAELIPAYQPGAAAITSLAQLSVQVPVAGLRPPPVRLHHNKESST